MKRRPRMASSIARLLLSHGIVAEARGNQVILSDELMILVDMEYHLLRTAFKQPIFKTESQLDMVDYLKNILKQKHITNEQRISN